MAKRPARPPIGSSAMGGRPAPAQQDRKDADIRGTRRRSGGAPGLSGTTTPFARPALAPSFLAAIVLLACVALIDSDPFVVVRWTVTVLALIVLVFAIRGRSWVGIVLAAAIAALWNPLVQVPFPGDVWAGLQIVAAAAFIVVGIVIRVPREDT